MGAWSLPALPFSVPIISEQLAGANSGPTGHGLFSARNPQHQKQPAQPLQLQVRGDPTSKLVAMIQQGCSFELAFLTKPLMEATKSCEEASCKCRSSRPNMQLCTTCTVGDILRGSCATIDMRRQWPPSNPPKIRQVEILLDGVIGCGKAKQVHGARLHSIISDQLGSAWV